jgi:hypothetical protein
LGSGICAEPDGVIPHRNCTAVQDGCGGAHQPWTREAVLTPAVAGARVSGTLAAMARIDRRGFLLAAATAALGAVGVGRLAPLPAASAAQPRLSARRAAALRALVGSLRAAPDGRFGAVPVVTVERRFVRWYAAQAADVRARTDAVLDAVAGRGVRRYGVLAREAASCRTAKAARDAAALAAAVDLAAIVCEPPPAEDERPVSAALELPR